MEFDTQLADGLMGARVTPHGTMTPNGVRDGEARGIGAAHDENEVAKLAYQYWQERGCTDGCADEDWFRAEQDLRSRISIE